MDTHPRRERGDLSGVPLSLAALGVGAFALIGASVLAPLSREDLGLGATGVGAIASAGYFGALVTSQWAGRLSDRLLPELVIVIGLLAIGAGVSVAAAAPGLTAFFLGVVLLGLGYGTVNPATSVLANPSSARRRALAMSLKQSGVPLGGVAAGAVLPGLAGAVGWRGSLVSSAVLCGLVALWAALAGRRSHRAATPPAPPSPGLSTGTVLRLPWGYGYGLLVGGVQVTLFAMVTVFLVEARGLSAQQAGLGASLLLAGGLCGRPAWGLLSDRHPARRLRVLQATALVGAVGTAAMLLATGPWLWVALLVAGVGAAGWNGVYIAAVSEAAAHRVGGSTGAALSLINVGAVAFPFLAGVVVEHLGGWTWTWVAATGVSLLAAAGLLLARRDLAAPPRTLRAGSIEEVR